MQPVRDRSRVPNAPSPTTGLFVVLPQLSLRSEDTTIRKYIRWHRAGLKACEEGHHPPATPTKGFGFQVFDSLSPVCGLEGVYDWVTGRVPCPGQRGPNFTHFTEGRVKRAPSLGVTVIHFALGEGLRRGEGHPTNASTHRSISHRGRVRCEEGPKYRATHGACGHCSSPCQCFARPDA